MASKSTTTERLYTTENVTRVIGTGMHFVRICLQRDLAPAPTYQIIGESGRIQPLWDEAGLQAWRVVAQGRPLGMRGRYERRSSTPPRQIVPGKAFSDHNAVNWVGPVMVTYRLWWASAEDGTLTFWFSTPAGWFTSVDGGRSWSTQGLMRRPSSFRYKPLNNPGRKGMPASSVQAANGAASLQRQIEREVKAGRLARSS